MKQHYWYQLDKILLIKTRDNSKMLLQR